MTHDEVDGMSERRMGNLILDILEDNDHSETEADAILDGMTEADMRNYLHGVVDANNS